MSTEVCIKLVYELFIAFETVKSIIWFFSLKANDEDDEEDDEDDNDDEEESESHDEDEEDDEIDLDMRQQRSSSPNGTPVLGHSVRWNLNLLGFVRYISESIYCSNVLYCNIPLNF